MNNIKLIEAYADYGLTRAVYGTDTITNTDLVRQLWLDNDFYGSIFSLHYKTDNSQFTLGGGWNRYEGNHYGDVIWAEKGLTLPGRWYDLDAIKMILQFILSNKQRSVHWCLFFMISNIAR